jgi:hypothetical protein
VSTENKYRIPAVDRLLTAAAPFLICVIVVFLFESRETTPTILKKKPRTIQSAVVAQDDKTRLGEMAVGNNIAAIDLQPPSNQMATRRIAKNYLHHQHHLNDHEFAEPRKPSHDSSNLVLFDLESSLSDLSPEVTAGSAGQRTPFPGFQHNQVALDPKHELQSVDSSQFTRSKMRAVPDADHGLQQMTLFDQSTEVEQEDSLLLTAEVGNAQFQSFRDPLIRQVQATSSANDGANPNSGVGADTSAEDPEEYGIPPPRRVPLFLQESTVLLEVGEYQYESGLRYSTNANVFPVAAILDGTAFVTNATRKQQTIITPLEFRVGIGDELQAFVNLPLGWSKQRTTAQSTRPAEDNKLGIGDLSFGLTKLLWEWKKDRTRLLGSASVSAPTGPSAFAIDSQSDYASLGRGYWTAGGGLNVVHTIDPLAFFGGIGYTQTFPTNADGGRTLDAGNTFFYTLGLGYAVNPTVSLNTAFSGGYTGELRLNDAKLAGTAIEPLSLKVAATFANVSKDDKKKNKAHHKYLKPTIREPFVRFGLTGAATDVDFGIRVTY